MSYADTALTRRALVTQATAVALLGSLSPGNASASGDAELLRLGGLMEVAWADERAAFARGILPAEEAEEVYGRTASIVREIENLPATTLDGLIVKARACHWTHDGEPIEPHFFSFSENNPTTDERLGAAILRDLLALAPTMRGT